MNIGLFTDTYFPQVSGVATSIKTLKDALEAQGHQVYIFTSTDPKVSKNKFEPHIYRFSSVPYVGFKDRRLAFRVIFIHGMVRVNSWYFKLAGHKFTHQTKRELCLRMHNI